MSLLSKEHICRELSTYKVGPRICEFGSWCCLPLLPGLVCSINTTWGPPISRALHSHWAATPHAEKEEGAFRMPVKPYARLAYLWKRKGRGGEDSIEIWDGITL